MLLKSVQAHRTEPEQLITQCFRLANISDAYDQIAAGSAFGMSEVGTRPTSIALRAKSR
jgi:Zn-dependent alcohol dehydrogenase